MKIIPPCQSEIEEIRRDLEALELRLLSQLWSLEDILLEMTQQRRRPFTSTSSLRLLPKAEASNPDSNNDQK